MILDDIVARKKQQLRREEEEVPLARLETMAMEAPRTRDFTGALRHSGISVIAEIKRASPSKGLIAADFHPLETARAYVQGGAACMSVLTERDFFQGSDDILQAVRSSVPCPVLRKDFLFTERQILQSRAIGADAVLLIVAILDDGSLIRLHRMAVELGVSVLVEAHTREEVERAVQAGATVIGINNRDLNTFQVSLDTFGRLRTAIPGHCLAVAESGIGSEEDVRRLRTVGCDAILVGEALMRSGQPAATLSAFRKAGSPQDVVR